MVGSILVVILPGSELPPERNVCKNQYDDLPAILAIELLNDMLSPPNIFKTSKIVF